MYVPGLYKLKDPEEIREFVRENGFGILVNSVNGRLWATHIPMMFVKGNDGKDILIGHLSKANPQWKEFRTSQEVLAVFTGPHAYISPSWYDHENVPTWNYLAVHIYGIIQIIEGEELKGFLSEMVDKYEASMPHPVSVDRMSDHFISSEMKGIVGFRILISEIQAARKLSQNRDGKNYQRIIEGLENQGDPDSLNMARIMKNNKSTLT
jgi:transcriptional regulator